MNTRKLFREHHNGTSITRCRSGELCGTHPIIYDRGDINEFHADHAASMNIPRGWAWGKFNPKTTTHRPGQYLLAIIDERGNIECLHSARVNDHGTMVDDFGYMGVYAHATHYLPIDYIDCISDGCWTDVDPESYRHAHVPESHQPRMTLADAAKANAANSATTPAYDGPAFFAPIGTETIGRVPAQILGGIYGIIAVMLYTIWCILSFLFQILGAVAASPLAIMELFG